MMEFRSSRWATRCWMIADRCRTYSSSEIRVLDGRSALRAPRLSPWGSERWDAMFVSVGSRILCVCAKSTTGSSPTAAARTASTSASCRSRCSSDYSLQTRYSARSPPYFAAADAECEALGFGPNMWVPSERGGRRAEPSESRHQHRWTSVGVPDDPRENIMDSSVEPLGRSLCDAVSLGRTGS